MSHITTASPAAAALSAARSGSAWSLSNLAAVLRFNLLTYRDLWEWLDDPFGVPIREPDTMQLTLTL